MSEQTNELSFPADLGRGRLSRASILALGCVSLTAEGLVYKPASRLVGLYMKINLMSRAVDRYYTDGEPFPYSGILGIRKVKNNCLELTTDRVNGSLYLSVPYAESGSLEDLMAFLEICRERGFDAAVADEALCARLRGHMTKARRDMLISAVILCAASFVLMNFYPVIGVVVSFFGVILAGQSNSKAMRTIAVGLLILFFVMALVDP